MNPLKQYFRRPAIYIKLPSQGKYYDSNVITMPENGDIPVYPMTAIDEITTRTPDAVFNGQAVVDIIKSCAPCIHDPWKINVIDLDTLLVAIRVASNGEEVDMVSTCPACKTENKHGLGLINLLNSNNPHAYDNTLTVNDLEIKFRPLMYTESNKNNLKQYEIEKSFIAIQEMEDGDEKARQGQAIVKYLNDAMIETIADTIEYIKTPDSVVEDKEFIKEFLVNCDKRTNTQIINYSVDLRNKTKMQPFKLKCINCANEYSQDLIINITDFFG
jgi:hypothetical protein